MCKFLNRRNKILVILGAVVVLVAAAYLGMNFLKKKGAGGMYDFFPNIQWGSPYSVKTANPFEHLKLNPFK